MVRGVRWSVEARRWDADGWTAARMSGDRVADIALAAGVSRPTVYRATSTRGPFPAHGTLAAVGAGWARRRWEGEPVAEIARQAGVSTSAVSAATKPFGPFPTLRTRLVAQNQARAEEWADLRRAGASLAAICRQDAVDRDMVSLLTRPLGPFPAPGPGGAGTLGLRGVSRMSGISLSALRRRRDKGQLPAPAGVQQGGWPYWRVADVQRWLEESNSSARRAVTATATSGTHRSV